MQANPLSSQPEQTQGGITGLGGESPGHEQEHLLSGRERPEERSDGAQRAAFWSQGNMLFPQKESFSGPRSPSPPDRGAKMLRRNAARPQQL